VGCLFTLCVLFAFSALTLLVGQQKGHSACKKTEWWGAGVVFCLEPGAELHLVQLMPLPLTVSCFSKIQIGFTSPVPAHLGSPGRRAVKRLCVCVCVCVCARRSRYTELVSPLIVHAQHKLVERISENGGRADSQPHWSAALAANSGLPITAADYIQLQLRVVVDVGAESAAVADPLGNVAYSRMSLQHLLLCFHARTHARTHTHTRFTALFPGLPG